MRRRLGAYLHLVHRPSCSSPLSASVSVTTERERAPRPAKASGAAQVSSAAECQSQSGSASQSTVSPGALGLARATSGRTCSPRLGQVLGQHAQRDR